MSYGAKLEQGWLNIAVERHLSRGFQMQNLNTQINWMELQIVRQFSFNYVYLLEYNSLFVYESQ